MKQLLLGKKYDNVIVFKYAVDCDVTADVDTEGKPYIIQNDEYRGHILCVSEKFTTQVDGFTQPDLTKLTDEMLYQLFRDVIEKDVQTHYFINAIMLNKTRAENYQCL